MAAPHSIQPMASEAAETLRATRTELAKLQQHCRHLNEALEVERAKTSKLRRYVSRMNGERPLNLTTSPAAEHSSKCAVPDTVMPAPNEAALQALVQDQTKLIEQLYAENEQHRNSLAALNKSTQQLQIANDKLKTCNIELRRKLKDKPTSSPDIHAGTSHGHSNACDLVASELHNIVASLEEIKGSVQQKNAGDNSQQAQPPGAKQWLKSTIAKSNLPELLNGSNKTAGQDSRWITQQV